ncbi:MAG TPA: MerR family DNA-binding transcriptional regulator, partial [Trebonia sp.]
MPRPGRPGRGADRPGRPSGGQPNFPRFALERTLTPRLVSVTTWSISEAADKCGLSQHTLRWYERIGLVGPVAR